MRRAAKTVLLVGIALLTMRCSEDESLDKFTQGVVVTSAPIHWAYIIPPNDTVFGSNLFGVNLIGDSVTVDTDSLRWVYDPSGALSLLSIAVSARDSVHILLHLPDYTELDGTLEAFVNSVLPDPQDTVARTAMLDSLKNRALDSVRVQMLLGLGVETYTDSVPGTEFLAPDYTGAMVDTVLIVASDVPGVIVPPQSSRLFVRYGDQELGTVELVNPW